MFDYSMFWTRGRAVSERKGTHCDGNFQSSHNTTPFSSRGGSSFQPDELAPAAKQLLFSSRPVSVKPLMASVDNCTVSRVTTDAPPNSEADEVQALLRRDSSRSGQAPMSEAYFGRCSRMSDKSLPRSRQTVSIDDRREFEEDRIHSPFNHHAPRRAMVRDAADRGRPRTSWLQHGHTSRASATWDSHRHDM